MRLNTGQSLKWTILVSHEIAVMQVVFNVNVTSKLMMVIHVVPCLSREQVQVHVY